jgi:hypothetical protein
MQIDFAAETRLYLGIYEFELDRHLRRILRPGVTAFDVGAQHGYDSLAMAHRTRSRVAAFECDEICLERMRQSLALNPALTTLVQLLHAEVGAGRNQLALDEWAYGGNGFVPDFVKVDVEGGEVSALRSAERILTERHPWLIVETHSQELEREAGEFLTTRGYRPVIVSQRKRFPDVRPIAHNRWLVAAA